MKKRYQRNHFKAFSNSVNKKKLYKKGKNWVVGSLTLLALAGLGVTANHTVHADGDANTKAATTSVGSTADIEHKAKAMYNGMIANQIANPSAGQPTQKGTPSPASAKSNVSSSSASQSSQSSSKANSVSAEMTAPSTANKTTSSAKTTTTVKPGLGGANPLAKNQPTSTSSQGSTGNSSSNSNSSVTPFASSSNGVNVKSAKSASQSASADQSPIAKAAALHNAVDKHNLNAMKPKRELGGGVPPIVLEGFLNTYSTTINNDLSKANAQYNQANKTANLDNDHRQINSDAQDFNNFKNIYKNSNGNFGYDSAMGKYNAFMNDYQNFENDVKTAVTPTDPLAKDGEQLNSVQNSLNTHYVSEINNLENGISHPSNDILNAYQVFNQWVNHFSGAVGHFNDMHNEAKEFQSMYPSLAQEDIQKALNSYEDAKSTVISQIGPAYTNYVNCVLNYEKDKFNSDLTNINKALPSAENDFSKISSSDMYTASDPYRSYKNDVNNFKSYYGNAASGFVSEASHSELNLATRDYKNAMSVYNQLNADYSNFMGRYKHEVNDHELYGLQDSSIASVSDDSKAASSDISLINQYTSNISYSDAYGLSADLNNEATSISNDLSDIDNSVNSLSDDISNNPSSNYAASFSAINSDVNSAEGISSTFNNNYHAYNNTLLASYSNAVKSLSADNSSAGSDETKVSSYEKIINSPASSNTIAEESVAFNGDYQNISNLYTTLSNEINESPHVKTHMFGTPAPITPKDVGGAFQAGNLAVNKANHEYDLYRTNVHNFLNISNGPKNLPNPNPSSDHNEALLYNAYGNDIEPLGGNSKGVIVHFKYNPNASDTLQLYLQASGLDFPNIFDGTQSYNDGIQWLPVDSTGKVVDPQQFTMKNSSGKPYTSIIPVVPTYKGMTFKYNQLTDSIEFTGTSAHQGQPYSDSNEPAEMGGLNHASPGVISDFSTFLSSAPKVIKDAKSITFDSDIDLSRASDMSSMFANNSNLENVVIKNNPSINYHSAIVKTMQGMFSNDQNLKSVSLPSDIFSTDNLTNMSSMFANDPLLTAVTLPNNMNASDVFNMSKMFYNDPRLSKINSLDHLSTSSVNNLSDMFNGDSALYLNKPSDLSTLSGKWNFNSDNVNTSNMFKGTPLLRDSQLSNRLEVKNNGTAPVTQADTSGAIYYHLFYRAPVKEQVTFTYYDWLTGKTIGSPVTESVDENTNVDAFDMPEGYQLANKAQMNSLNYNYNTWDTNSDINPSSDFQVGDTPKSVKIGLVPVDLDGYGVLPTTSSDPNPSKYAYRGMSSDPSDLTLYGGTLPAGFLDNGYSNKNQLQYIHFQNGYGQHVKAPANASGLFANLPYLQSIDGPLDTSNTTSMSGMFNQDPYLNDISTLSYKDKNGKYPFNTGNVTDMSFMFANDPALTSKSIDLSHFNTSKVENMSVMFGNDTGNVGENEPGLTSLDLSSFDTRSLAPDTSTNHQTGVDFMFYNDKNLRDVNFGKNFGTLTDGGTGYSTSYMFENDNSLQHLTLNSKDYFTSYSGLKGNWFDTSKHANNSSSTLINSSNPGDWTRDAYVVKLVDSNDNNKEIGEPKVVKASDVNSDLNTSDSTFKLPHRYNLAPYTSMPTLNYNGKTYTISVAKTSTINLQLVDIDTGSDVGNPISFTSDVGSPFSIHKYYFDNYNNSDNIKDGSDGSTLTDIPNNYWLFRPYTNSISDDVVTPSGQSSTNIYIPQQFTDKPQTVYLGVVNKNAAGNPKSHINQSNYIEFEGNVGTDKPIQLLPKGSITSSDPILKDIIEGARNSTSGHTDQRITKLMDKYIGAGYSFSYTSSDDRNAEVSDLADKYGEWSAGHPFMIHVNPEWSKVLINYWDTSSYSDSSLDKGAVLLQHASLTYSDLTGTPVPEWMKSYLNNHGIYSQLWVLDGYDGDTNNHFSQSPDNSKWVKNNEYLMNHPLLIVQPRTINVYIKQVGQFHIEYINKDNPNQLLSRSIDTPVTSRGKKFNIQGNDPDNQMPYIKAIQGYHFDHVSSDPKVFQNDLGVDGNTGGLGVYPQTIKVYYAQDKSNIHVHYINTVTGKTFKNSNGSSDEFDDDNQIAGTTPFDVTKHLKTFNGYHITGGYIDNVNHFSPINGATNDIEVLYAPDRGNAEVNYIDDATGKSIKTVDSDFRSDGTWNVSDYFKPGQVSDSWKYTGKVSDNVSDGSGHNSVTPGLNFNTKSLNIPDNKDDKGKITLNIYVHQPKSTVTVHYVTKGADGKYDQSVGLANVTTNNVTGANFNVSPYDNKWVSGYHRVGASDLTNNYPATDKANADVYIKYDPNHSYIHVHYIEPSDNNKVLVNSDNVSDNDVTKNTSFDINNYLNENFANKSDYTQKSIINPVTQFSKNNGDVENVYVPYSRKRSTITVNYFDMSDNQPLSDPEIFHSDVNNSFNVGNHEKSFNNYTQDHIINGSVNKFTDNDQTIDIFYRRNYGTIKVQYLDATNHDHLLSTVSSSNKVGNPFDINDYVNKPINGYHEQSVDANGIDQFKSGTQTATVYYAPNIANIHVYYEDADTGREISGYPESLASSATNASFNFAPYVKTINGYHFINSMHPANSYDANNDETHTIDLIYAPNSSSTTNSSAATDTVNYLISGTNSAVAPSSTDSVEFSRAVSSASGQAPSYGKWMTDSAFAPVTYNSVIISNGVRYQEVSANTAVPTPNMASDDFNTNHTASFSNDIYYVPANANVHVYFEAESDGHQLASQSDFTSSVNAPFSLADYENRFNNAGYHYVTALHPADSYDPNTGEVHTIDLLYAKNNQTTSNVAPESAAVTETTYDEWNHGASNVSEAASATTYHYTRNGSLVYNPATKNYSDHYSDWKLLNNSSTSNRSINLNGYYYETTVGNLPSAATLQNLAPNANVSYSDYQLYAPNSASYTNSAVSGAATETVDYYENGSLVSSATYTSGVNLNRNALVSANNHNYVVDPGEWRVASGRGFALPASASFAGYYVTSSNGNVPLNTLNVDPGNYSENVYYSPAKANIHVYYEDADNGNNMLPNNSFSDFTSSVNAPFHMSTLGDYQAKFNNQNYHFVGEMHPANGNKFDPNNGETHTIDLLYAPNKPQVPGAKSSIHVHYIDSDDHPVTVNGRVSDNFNNRQAGTAFTMPHISDVAGYQSGNENVINPVTKFSSDNGSVTNVYVQYHKVVPGVQPITVNYLSSDNTKLGSDKYTNANTTMSDIQKDINGKTFNNYTHVNTLNMPSGFTTHPQTVYVIYRPDHPVTHRGHIHVRYVDENNHDREFWSDKFSDNPGTPFDLRIDNYAVRYVPDRVFDKIISGYTPGHPINFGNQSATDPYVIVVGYAKPKPKSSASATPSSTASSASSKASSASSKASSSVSPSASSSVSSSASQPSSSASRMSSAPVIPSSQASSQSSVAPQHRSARATNNQPKLKTKQTKPVYIPKNGKGRAIRRQMIREIEKLENLIDQDIRAIQSRVVAVHKYDEHAHKQQMVHEIHIKREDLAKKEVHLRKLKAHKLPQTGEPQSYSAMYAMLFVLSSVILAGLGKAIEKRRHE